MLLPAVEFLKTFRTFRIHDGPDFKHRLWWHWWRLIGCLHWNPIHGPVFTLPPSDSELYQAHPQWYYSWPAPNWFCKHFSCIAQKSPSTEASKCCSHTWLSLVASLSGESMCDCEYLILVYGRFHNVRTCILDGYVTYCYWERVDDTSNNAVGGSGQSGHTWEASRKNRLLEFLPFTLPAPTPSAKLTPAINTSPGHQHHPTQALMFLMEQSTLSPQAHDTKSHNLKHTTLHCVTRAPLLYFIRSWVALSFKVVSQWVSQSGIGN